MAGQGQAVVIKDDLTGKSVEVLSNRALRVSGDLNLQGADIQIGAVEIKDGSIDARVTVRSYDNANPIVTIGSDTSGDVISPERSFKKQYYDWDANSNCIYIGEYLTAAAVSGDGGCIVQKLIYFANNDLKSKEVRTGTWTNHANLGWIG